VGEQKNHPRAFETKGGEGTTKGDSQVSSNQCEPVDSLRAGRTCAKLSAAMGQSVWEGERSRTSIRRGRGSWSPVLGRWGWAVYYQRGSTFNQPSKRGGAKDS